MKLAITILIIELFILIICFGCIVGVRLWRNWSDRQKAMRRNKLSELFSKSIETKKVLRIGEIDPKLLHYQDVLASIENFDRFFLDPTWEETKDRLIDDYLAKDVEKLIKSSRWKDRQLGLRTIVLSSKKIVDVADIEPLLKDPKFLIRVLAAKAMLQADNRQALYAVLKQMVQEAPLGRYAYRDLLINSGEANFNRIEEIAGHEKNPHIVAACLDALSTKISHNLLPLAIKHMNSENLECRLASIKIFSTIPGEESKKFLIEALQDKSWKVRAEAASGLGKLLAVSAVRELTTALSDPEWLVRVQAAAALKNLGKEGRAALYHQSPEKNLEAYEIAQYILALS